MEVETSLTPTGYQQYIKMQVIPDVKGTTLGALAQETIENSSTISIDAYSSYQVLVKEVYVHETK